MSISNTGDTTFSGNVTAASVSTSGSMTAASLTTSGSVTAASLTTSGDVTVGGHISLGIYVETDTPTAAIWDEACSKNANDVAIAGGGFGVGAVVLRESRPSVSLAPGNTGVPNNSWRVTCSNAGVDTKCVQAYVVCLSHGSP